MEKQTKNKNILYVIIGLVVISMFIFIFSDEKKASDNKVVYDQYEQKTNEVQKEDANKDEQKQEKSNPNPNPNPHIEPSIKVLSPNGGEKIMLESANKTYTIKWKTTGFISTNKITIFLQDDSVFCAPNIVGCSNRFLLDTVSNTGSFVWNLNEKIDYTIFPGSREIYPGDRFKIVVSGAPNNNVYLSDESDGEFTISVCPVYTSLPVFCTGKLVSRLDENGCYMPPVCEQLPSTQSAQ